jgi:type VI secretion system secreted protein VgrG
MEAFEHAELKVGEDRIVVHELHGREALSELFSFELSCTSDAPPHRLIGQRAMVTLRDAHDRRRRLHGIVSRAERETRDDGSFRARLEVRPKAHLLSIGRNCRVFHDQSTVQIAATLLAERGCAVRDDTREQYALRPYTAQYREDDWSFMTRLLADDGIYLRFEHDETDTVVVLEDTSLAAPELRGGAALAYSPETGRLSSEERVHRFAREVHAVPDRFTIGSYDPNRPDMAIAGGTGEGAFEIYQSPAGGPGDPELCRRRARIQHERSRLQRRAFVASSTSARIEPGRIVQLVGHPLLDGRYLVTEARYHVRQRQTRAGQLQPLRCDASLTAAELAFRPIEPALPGRQAGLQIGSVVGEPNAEVHPDAQGRVRVKHHWDREPTRDHRAGTWMRVAQRGAAGSMLLPRVGWNLITFNDEGAIDAPSVLSRIHDGILQPSYALPSNKTRTVFRTATTPGGGSNNEIRMEDGKGAEELMLHASRDMKALVQQDKHEDVHEHLMRSVGANQRLAVSRSSSETVKGAQTVDIAGDEHVKISHGDVRSIGKEESITVGGSRQLQTGAGHQSAAAGTRSLVVGAAVIDASLGSIAASSGGDHVVAAGGGVARAASESIVDETGRIGAELVGGVKLEVASGDYRLRAVTRLEETVVGALSLHAGGRLIDISSSETNLTAGDDLALVSPELHLVATDKVEISCGASKIIVEPNAIAIEGPTLTLATSSTVVSTSRQTKWN